MCESWLPDFKLHEGSTFLTSFCVFTTYSSAGCIERRFSINKFKWVEEKKEGRKNGREDGERVGLTRSPLIIKPGLSVLLAKFLKTFPWATFTTGFFWKNLLRNQIFGKTHVMLSFYWLLVFHYVLFSWIKWSELIILYSEIRKKFLLRRKKNSLASVGHQITFPPTLIFYESLSFGLSKYTF